MLSLSFIEFLTEAKGGVVSHRGTLNELAFVHAIERYNELLNKRKGNHDAAINDLVKEGHIDHNTYTGPYADRIKKAKSDIGDKETDRTLWDSHHAAVSLLNHIHRTKGGISGPAVWTGGDTSGETVRKITGVNTQADILIPTKSGENVVIERPNKKSRDDWQHSSLKYSEKSENAPTKMFQGTAREAAEIIQKHHEKNFGKRDEALDNAVEKLEASFGDVGEKLKSRSKVLAAAGIQPKNGEYSVKKVSDLARYAHTALNHKDPEERARTRAKLETHLQQNNIPRNQWDTHFRNLADIHENVIKSDKVSASKDYSDAFHNALKKSWNEAKSGQNSLLRSLLNVRERRNQTVMVVKTQRNEKVDHNQDPVGALPKVSIASHANDLEALMRRGLREGRGESQLYDNVKKKEDSASSTISKRNGKSIASFSIDTGKTSPSLIAKAGSEIDNFKDISTLHPSHPQYKPVAAAAPAPARTASNPPPSETYHPSHGGKIWSPT